MEESPCFESSPLLSELLREVKKELLARYTTTNSSDAERNRCSDDRGKYSKAGRNSSCTLNGISWGDNPVIILDALEADDWNSIIYPLSDLRPYMKSVCPHDGACNIEENSALADYSVVESYVQCRCAELPMRLQAEALELRHHEEVRRQNLKHLILLSQYVAYAAPCRNPGDDNIHSTQPSPLVPSAECTERLHRCQQCIPDLEQKIVKSAMAKRRCSQRMVLMSAVVYALVDRLDLLLEDHGRGRRSKERKM